MEADFARGLRPALALLPLLCGHLRRPLLHHSGCRTRTRIAKAKSEKRKAKSEKRGEERAAQVAAQPRQGQMYTPRGGVGRDGGGAQTGSVSAGDQTAKSRTVQIIMSRSSFMVTVHAHHPSPSFKRHYATTALEPNTTILLTQRGLPAPPTTAASRVLASFSHTTNTNSS